MHLNLFKTAHLATPKLFFYLSFLILVRELTILINFPITPFFLVYSIFFLSCDHQQNDNILYNTTNRHIDWKEGRAIADRICYISVKGLFL